jgi:FtsP/CotA-like multicopper oxidase with cupredoxin domain
MIGLRRGALVVALAAVVQGVAPDVWACGANLQPEPPAEQVFELHLEGGEVAQDLRMLRVTEGDHVRLRWTADAPTVVHLHGYDLEQEVAPGRAAEFQFEAYATGRFTIEVHAEGDAGYHSHGEAPLVVLEVYPR